MIRTSKVTSAGRDRAARVQEQRFVREQLVSVAGLVRRPVRLGDGREVGRVLDLVVEAVGERSPALKGVVAGVGRRRAFVPAERVAAVGPAGVVLSSSRLDVRDFVVRPGEVRLMADVVDRQLVDLDGVQVVRAADVYVTRLDGRWHVVGVETGARSLLRRLGPAPWRARAKPGRVIDWVDVEPLGAAGRLRLQRANAELQRLRPGELADLLERLGQPQREQLVDALEDDAAADALEEMDDRSRDRLLRQLSAARTTAIVAAMEPDEAADALRRVGPAEREQLLAALPAAARARVRPVLDHDADTAGGIMTTVLAEAAESDTVAAVRDRLRALEEHRLDIDAVLVVAPDGRLLDDVSLFELAVAAPQVRLGDLIRPPWPIVVGPQTPLDGVLDAVLSNRRGSVVVVDDDGRALGRILADDVLDALVPRRGRLHRELVEP